MDNLKSLFPALQYSDNRLPATESARVLSPYLPFPLNFILLIFLLINLGIWILEWL